MNLIARLLEKVGVPDRKALTPEEKETLEHWEGVLSSGEVNVDSIVKFCENQIKRIESSWRNLDNPEKKNDRLVTQHAVYSTLLSLIKAPVAEKEALEKHLEAMIK